MGLIAKLKSWFGGMENFWTPITRPSGYGAFGGFTDVYGTDPEPTPVELISAYEDIVFTCVSLISTNVGSVRPKLCVTTSPGQREARSLTKALPLHQRRGISNDFPAFTRKAIDVQEVIDHPLLDILDRPNPVQSFGKLLEMTSAYVELTGSAFLYKARNTLGEVKELWLMPTQNVGIETDDYGHVTGYTNQSPDGETQYLRREDVIHVKSFNPADPYAALGTPPLRACWQRVQLLRKEQASWDSVLSNMAFPSALVYPPDGEIFTDTQAERIAKQLSERFRYGNQGGVFVVQDGLKFTPVSTPPKDLSALTMYEQIKECVCNAYGPGILTMLNLNASTLGGVESAERFFQKYTLKPRVVNIFETLTHHLCPDRLFFAAHDVVEPDQTFELQRSMALFQANAITVNELRSDQGLPPVENGDKFLYQVIGSTGGGGTMGTLPSFQGGKSFPLEVLDQLPAHQGGDLDPVTTLKKKSAVVPSELPDPNALAEALAEVFRQLRPRIAAMVEGVKDAPALVTKAGPVEDFAREFASRLTPVLRVYFEEGTNSILANLEGVEGLRTLPVQALDSAVNAAVLALADSTLSTTQEEVGRAVELTREAIRAGLDQGEANRQLSDRISEIFTDLETRRAYLIAETESARAKHNGELLAIQGSGIEARKVWMADGLACPKCAPLDGVSKALNEPFAVVGTGPYGVIEHPPYHPACRCTLGYEFPDVAD